MNNSYDVAIIGCGTAGIFAGYELIARHPELKICVLDQGGDIYSRHCPIVAGKVKECIHCSVCDTMCGFGGAGAFSDGKYNFTTQFGGWLTDFMDDDEVMELINYVDTVNMNGDGFEGFVKADDVVKAGQPILKIDRAKIAAAGYKDCVVVAVSNTAEFADVELAVEADSAVAAGDAIVKVVRK